MACGVRALALQDGREVDGRGLVKWDGKGGRTAFKQARHPPQRFHPRCLMLLSITQWSATRDKEKGCMVDDNQY